jgi:hypothetical protein
MKLLPLFALGCALVLSGCESGLSDDVREALGPREAPQTRSYDADPRATFEAARQVAVDMGFRVTRAGAAAGELEAISEISSGDEPGTSRQVSLKAHLSPGPSGGTELELSLTEILQGATGAQESLATQTPLRDTPMYADFFRNVQTALSGAAK